ncbi:MAG TPA: hypothetical protein VMK13_12660 [Streptosporangiaceae bacterium]|nr:hypothetical protein [Streptosporangiaceae bacterium]
MSIAGYCADCGRYANRLPGGGWEIDHNPDCHGSPDAADAGRDMLVMELARQLAEARQQIGQLEERQQWLITALGVPGGQQARRLEAVRP